MIDYLSRYKYDKDFQEETNYIMLGTIIGLPVVISLLYIGSMIIYMLGAA
ncbi:hypothetical protein [Metabacillus fastidiosus]